ncbi:hypothetical protein SprV_1002804100 [Sparganum proliferum]
MGPFGHMRIYESVIDRSTDSSIIPNPTPTSPTCATAAPPATDTDTTDFTCPHCPRTLSSRIGLVGYMRIHENGIDRSPDTPTTSNISTAPSQTLVLSPGAPITTTTTTTTDSAVDDTATADFSCPHCPRSFTSRIGLVGHLRIHHIESNEPVLGAPTYTHHARLNYAHCPRTFRHRMGLFGHMRIHDDPR